MLLTYRNPNLPTELNQQIYRYFIFSVLCGIIFIYNIIVLFYKYFELSYTAIMFVSSIENWFSLIFEIPSGILSDIWGRKKTVIVGMVISAIALLVYIVYPSITFFVAAEALLAVGGAFLSGTCTAIIYDKFKQNGYEAEYADYVSFSTSRKFIISSVVSISSSLLFSISVYLPFILSFLFQIIALFVFISVRDEFDNKTATPAKTENLFNMLRNHVKSSFVQFSYNRRLLVFTFISSFFVLVISNMAYLSQPYLTEMGLDIKYLGAFFLLCNIATSLSATKSKKIYERHKEKIFLAVTFYLGFIFCFLSLRNLYLSIILLILSRLSNGIVFPAISVEINKNTTDENRATILSVVVLIESVALIIFDPLIGVLMDNFGIHIVYLIFGIITLFIAGSLAIFSKRIK